jgi:hypothetical protein
VRPGAGITKPADLRGKRIGVSQYAASAIVYMRGMMQHDYGLMPGDTHWFQGGLNVPAPPPKVPLKLPPEVKFDYLRDDETLEAMIEKGALDALYSVYIPTIFRNGSPSIARLWSNFKEVETEYLPAHRHLPGDAPRRHPRGRAPRPPRGRRAHLPGILRGARPRARSAARQRRAPRRVAVPARPRRGDVAHLMGSSRTAPPSKRWAAISSSRASRRA